MGVPSPRIRTRTQIEWSTDILHLEPGHSNLYGNEIADQLAGQVALNPDQADIIVHVTSWGCLKGFQKRTQAMHDWLKEWEDRTTGLAYHYTPSLEPRESVLTLPMAEARVIF
jgi:hypothetical protein